MRLSSRDSQAVRALQQSLGVIHVDGPPALVQLMPAVRDLLGVELACAYGMARSTEGFALTFCHGASHLPLGRLRAGAGAFVSAQKSRWGLFDPIRPEPLQRNRVVQVPTPEEAAQLMERNRLLLVRKAGVRRSDVRLVSDNLVDGLERMLTNIGFSGRRQLRVLVCDGDALLAWFGVLHSEPFTAREKQILEALVPQLARRLRLERLLELEEGESVALSAALEHVPRAAFVLSGSGAVRHANAAGRALWDDARGELREALDAARKGAPGTKSLFELTRLPSQGAPSFLAVQKPQVRADVQGRVAWAGQTWGLTPRQTQVLELLARGQANKTIAGSLGCALHTVELHVSAILEKAEVPSRAELLAVLWSQSE